jgi:pimeloyl-ACP methyl ester carboxylesterase
MIMNVIEVNGVKLHVEEIGTGPTVILVHGIPSDYRVWSPQVDVLSRHYRTISYSRRCACPNQFSDYASSTIEKNATDLEELIAWAGGGPAHLIGHSYGGPIIALCTLRHPELVRSLVLIEPHLPGMLVDPRDPASGMALYMRNPSLALSGQASLSNIKATQEEVSRKNPEKALDGYYPNTWKGSDVKVPLSASARAVMLDNTETFYELLTGMPTFNPEDAARIAPPTLVMAGEHTVEWQSGVAAELHQTIPNNRLAIIPNAAHYPHVENPDECTAKILTFLSEQAH